MSGIRLIIADDHQIFIDGLKALLSNDERFQIMGEARNGKELLELLEVIETDIVVMDVNMPIMTGIEATKEISKKYPIIRVLMLTMHNQKEYIAQLLSIGAEGYILKNCTKNELTEALLSISSNKPYFSREVTDMVMEGLKAKKRLENNPEPELSKREIEVLKMIAQGFTTKEIAHKLFISENTVETHRKNLVSKTNERNMAGLVRYAIEKHLLD